MRKSISSGIMFCLLTLSACDSDSEQSVQFGESVEFTSIYKTPARDSGGTTLEGRSKSFRVFYSQTEFNTFVQRYPLFSDILNQSEAVPSQTDFEAGSVIMTYLGEKNSAGYDIEIASVNLTASSYAVVSIQSEMGAAGCPQDGAITYPMHLIYLPIKVEFVFEEVMSVYTC